MRSIVDTAVAREVNPYATVDGWRYHYGQTADLLTCNNSRRLVTPQLVTTMDEHMRHHLTRGNGCIHKCKRNFERAFARCPSPPLKICGR